MQRASNKISQHNFMINTKSYILCKTDIYMSYKHMTQRCIIQTRQVKKEKPITGKNSTRMYSKTISKIFNSL